MPVPGVTRRHMLATSVAVLGTTSREAALGITPGDRSLKDRAAARGLTLGYMVATGNDEVPLSDTSIIVPENAMKWNRTEPQRGVYAYDQAEAVVRLAERLSISCRGHTAFWYKSNPDWIKDKIGGPEGRADILRHVADLVGHFRGRILEWDVVNEAVEPRDGRPDRLRTAALAGYDGFEMLEQCFWTAHEADPRAKLFYNDFGFEEEGRPQLERRRGVLNLVTGLKTRGVPIHGLGIQAHIGAAMKFSATPFRAFLKDVADLGLKIRLTEFDVCDAFMGGGVGAQPSAQDLEVARYASEFLSVAFDERAVSGLLCWGVRDKDSWLRRETWARRKDGQPNRPLPYDDEFRRKPLWRAISDAVDSAPAR